MNRKNISEIFGKVMVVCLFNLVLISVQTSADSWSCFRGNPQRTGFSREKAGIPGGKPIWKISLGCSFVSSPSVVDGMLFIGGRDSTLYAIRVVDGSVQWKCRTDGWVDASPLVQEKQVIIGSRDNSIYIVDKSAGYVLGRMAAGIQLSSPCMTANNTILTGLGLAMGGIAAYTVQSSQWKESVPQWSISLPQYTYSSPAVYGQAAVIGATDGKLYGIDISKMDTMWSLSTKGGIYLSTPAIDGLTVYFAPGDADNAVYAVDLLTGRILWKGYTETQSSGGLNRLGKRMSMGTVPYRELAQLPRMSPADRKQLLRRLRSQGLDLPKVSGVGGLGKKAVTMNRKFAVLEGRKTSSVAVNPENIFVIQKQLGYVIANDSLLDDKQEFCIQALDKRTGAKSWSFSEWRNCIHLGYCSSPVATENVVYFGWGEGRLYGLASRTGEVLWTDSVQGNIISSPAIAMGKLFVATMDGLVYAYDLSSTPPGLDFQKSTYCYPNPARGDISHIQIYPDRHAKMSMTLYTMSDKPVVSISQDLPPGQKYTYEWSLVNVANGVYFARISVTYDDGTKVKKTLKIAVLK